MPNNFREKDDSKGECTARSEMRISINAEGKAGAKGVQKIREKNAKKIEKIPKKCLTALWRSYIIALASRGIRNAETRYTTEAVKLFAGVVQW